MINATLTSFPVFFYIQQLGIIEQNLLFAVLPFKQYCFLFAMLCILENN